MSDDLIFKDYVDCACIVCGWTDGFKPSVITNGFVGGLCEECARESLFRQVTAPDPDETIRRAKAFIVDNAQEVKNGIGGVIGYKLNLNTEQLDALLRILEGRTTPPQTNSPCS